jgi:hypothetical protein
VLFIFPLQNYVCTPFPYIKIISHFLSVKSYNETFSPNGSQDGSFITVTAYGLGDQDAIPCMGNFFFISKSDVRSSQLPVQQAPRKGVSFWGSRRPNFGAAHPPPSSKGKGKGVPVL